MKRLLFSVIFVLLLLLCSSGIINAETVAQESDEIDLISAVNAFSELLSAGVSAAGTQIITGYTGAPVTSFEEGSDMSDPAVSELPDISEEEQPETISEPVTNELPVIPEAEQTETIPEPVISEQVSVSEKLPVEPSHEAPQDPESVGVSTGIEVRVFYDAFKSSIKNSGRHSVAFEEKGKKSTSKATVDDNVEVYLRYTKEKGINSINRITYTEQTAGRKAETIFVIMLQTLCDLLNIDFAEDDGSEIYGIVSQGGSLVYSDLLLYGKADSEELNVQVYYTGSGYVEPSTTNYTLSADEDFHALIDDLKQTGTIPNNNGTYYFHEDYTQEWARINWVQWQPFATAKNFVISADISWDSASRTPNYSESGCGFIMRELDNSNYLHAEVRLDGRFYLGGLRRGSRLSYGSYNYGTRSYKGEAQLVLIANENKFNAYVDGAHMGKQQDIAISDNGSLAFTVWSGTNKDYGIRCTFRNVFYYIW